MRCEAQQHNAYPLNHITYSEFEGMLQQPGERFHTSVRPYRIHELNESIPFDSLRHVRYHSGKFARTWVGRKMVMESLLRVDSAKFQVFFDPVFQMDYGYDLEGKVAHVVNTRGFVCSGSIGRKLSFITTFYENQSTFLPYMSDWIERNKVIPGQGWLKPFTFDNFFYNALGVQINGYDYLTASGAVSFTPVKNFNVQLGHDKHFFGEGYRSLLLSDVAFNYPFLKLTTKWRGLQYVHLLTQMQDVNYPQQYETGFKKKWATFHYLSANIGKRVQVGLFEGIIFKTADSAGNGGFDWNFINPLMMIRPVQFAIQQSDQNVVVGLNLKVIPFKGAAFYGQLAFNDLNFNRMNVAGHIGQRLGWQVGFKAFDLFNVRHLIIQLEYNAVRPYTYASSQPILSYMHFAQPLGHPLGANFHEVMGMFGYRWRDLRFQWRATYALVGRDPVGANFGNDIYLSDTEAVRGTDSGGNHIGQGQRTHLFFQNAELAYTINRASNFTLRLGLTHRVSSNSLSDERNLMVYFGVRTDIRNLYADF
ncbi:MAG: hypothetical protein K9J06_09760 [Flavobacteriales bacterium]|nr:hypothetical protein [Flavobacteriales bacterium]